MVDDGYMSYYEVFLPNLKDINPQRLLLYCKESWLPIRPT